MAETKLSQSTKEMPCRYCDKPMTVNGYQRKPPHHIECAVMASLQNAVDLHNHSGPGYEKWRNAMIRVAERLR